MRDLQKLITAGQAKLTASPIRDLSVEEVAEIIEKSSLPPSNGLVNLISRVYSLGFEVGYRGGQRKSRAQRRLTV